MTNEAPAGRRPPVLLGCVGVVVFVGIVVVLAVAAAGFFESGANSGKLTLASAESYANGSVEFVAQRNFFLSRLGDGSFMALSDLDTANRANQQRRCRVAPITRSDPKLPQLLASYAGRMSAKATGATLLFREDCNLAVYDVTGVRLDGEGANLDRFPVEIDSTGRVTVDVSRRICTKRDGENALALTAC